MARILCLSAPMAGHLDWGGYLPTAKELQRRGHKVLWASGAAIEDAARGAGMAFHPLVESGWRWPLPPPVAAETDSDGVQDQQYLRMVRALDQWLDVVRVRAAVYEIRALCQVWQPDLIVSEMFVAAAAIVAEALALPFVVAGWPAQTVTASVASAIKRSADSVMEMARQRLQALLAEFGCSGRYWSDGGAPALLSPYLHLSYWSERWFGESKLLPQTRHVGGRSPAALPPIADLPPPEDRPWVLITLGTSFGNDINFFLASAHAANRLGCLPLLVLAGQLDLEQQQRLAARLPPGTALRQLVHFAATLPYAAAAIHHGGAGLTHALVTHAVPQIVVPHAADQQRQANGVLRSGVGLAYAPKDVTIDRLEAALAAVLPDLSNYRAAAGELRNEFAALGGIPAAAAAVERVL